MSKFRKKPVVIEAFQWFPQSVHPFFHKAAIVRDVETEKGRVAYIDTLEGRMIVQSGDWIIKGVKGEFYPCKPDIFAATYEEVPS